MEDERRRRFELLFAETYEAVLAYALRRSGPELAQDVIAETYLVAWRRLEQVPRDPVPWLLGVARRVLANQRRGERRREALVERLASESAPTFAREVVPDRLLAAALGMLSERDRELLLLVAWEGLDQAALARVLGCSRAVVAVRLHRARKRVAAAIEELESERSLARAPGLVKGGS